jgi:SNF2-related domain
LLQGKTLQTISLLAYLRESRGVKGPHIAIVPKSVVGNWIREVNRWCPAIHAVRMGGTKQERDEFIKNHLHGSFDVLVTSYEGFLREKSKLAKVKWHYLIIDEVCLRVVIAAADADITYPMCFLGPSHQVAGFVPQQGCTHSRNAVSAIDYRYSASGSW